MSESTTIVTKSVIILAVCALVQPKFHIIFHNIKILCNEPIITNCSIKSDGPTFNGFLALNEELSSMNMDLQFSIRHRNSHQYQTLANFSQDFCKFIKNPYDNPFASLFWGLLHMGKQNRVFNECPIPTVSIFFFCVMLS